MGKSEMDKNKIQLEVLGLSNHNRQDAFALILSEVGGNRRLPIVIGLPEAQSIAVRLENIRPARPLTHDLLYNMATTFGIDILEIVVHDLRDGIFYSKLVCRRDGELVEIDSRTSDAVAIALRFGCPIYTYDDVMRRASIICGSNNDSHQQDAQRLVNMDDRQLKSLMNEAIVNEDYERASKIRDILNSRSEQSQGKNK